MLDQKDSDTWCIIRLVTFSEGKDKKVSRLLFATVTELTPGRPLPTAMKGVHSYKINKDCKLFFRRTILTKDEAIKWYLGLEQCSSTPTPTRKEDCEDKLDGVEIQVPSLTEDQPWPTLGLPINDNILSSADRRKIDPAPFIGSIPSRIHRRFGDSTGFEAFFQDENAQQFVARRMHINLYEFQEYLGSAVYISPNPIIKDTHYFMVPSDNQECPDEHIVYRFIPRLGENFDQVTVTTFDKEAELLTSFESHTIPKNGILVVKKGILMGEYGFIATHKSLGILYYQKPTPFLRQSKFSIQIPSSKNIIIQTPSSDSKDSPMIEYVASADQHTVSESTLGIGVDENNSNIRVNMESRRRRKLAQAKELGQQWFNHNSRKQASTFIIHILRSAKNRVIIADPYLGELQISQFLYAIPPRQVELKILTTRQAFNSKTESRDESKTEKLYAFKQQIADLKKYQKLKVEAKIIPSNFLHDRFLVIDNEVWFMGSSLNSIGDKGSMLMKLPEPESIIEILESFSQQSTSLDKYINEVNKQKESNNG